MARAPDPKVQQAKEMYLKGMQLADIAKDLEKPEGTIRRWKHSYDWDNERSEKNSERSERKKATKKTAISEEVTELDEESDLSDKQKLFCLLYVKYFNATKAYQKAYGCSYDSAVANGSRLLRNDKVKNEIKRLKQGRLNKEMLSVDDVMQKYINIAFSDITDFVEFDETDVHLKSSTQIDGTLIKEVKMGKFGPSIKLIDSTKGLKWLSDHFGKDDRTTSNDEIKIMMMEDETE